jgi:hypothetical protein
MRAGLKLGCIVEPIRIRYNQRLGDNSMPRFLMDHCLNNRTECSNTRVSFSRWPKVFRCSDEIPQFLEGKEQEELDTSASRFPDQVPSDVWPGRPVCRRTPSSIDNRSALRRHACGQPSATGVALLRRTSASRSLFRSLILG